MALIKKKQYMRGERWLLIRMHQIFVLRVQWEVIVESCDTND